MPSRSISTLVNRIMNPRFPLRENYVAAPQPGHIVHAVRLAFLVAQDASGNVTAGTTGRSITLKIGPELFLNPFDRAVGAVYT